ncbi:MAG: diphthine--ammonia ligase [Thermoplasmatota archaeon]|nr:diphthine--ammonia ligase [Candidatus Thermoplasmatota archaeon]MBU1914634.1 diphthine--ammonia ligase [Candidatus Thermoplasmatota archaeon]
MRVSALFSGGKDSTYALYLLQQQGWDVMSLLTVVPKASDSYMFHYPNIRWTKLQAESMNIAIKYKESSGLKEEELRDVEALMAEEDTDGFVCGAIASDYQWSRLNEIAHRLGKPMYAPLWRKDQLTLLEDMVQAGFKFMIAGVYAEGFDEGWLGKVITSHSIKELEKLREKHRISVTGEGGELETFVLDGPNFSKSIQIEEAQTNWSRHSGNYTIKKASLEEK